MVPFINDDFLLQCDISKDLYNSFAKDLPIIDYHCHINPEDIAKDVVFTNISDIWFSGDHYKWRLLRAYGIDEKYITGDASPKEKFLCWAKVISKAFGNPLYHWNCLELSRYFGILEPLTPDNAEEIWEKTSRMMKENPENFSARALIKRSNVEVICTTDDPSDSLIWHKKIAEDKSFKTRVLPSFRPDRLIDIERDTYKDYLSNLSLICGFEINSLDTLLAALDQRIDYFNSVGCRISDHGMEYILYEETNKDEVAIIFEKELTNNSSLTPEDLSKFKSFMLIHCAKRYFELNWTMQYHFGCIRNTNKMRFNTLGADCGCDSISGSYNFITPLSKILSQLSEENALPRTILYSLNPNDNTSIDTLIGCFQGDNRQMRIQHGSAWWFNDNMDGMINQLKSLANQSYLPGFVGMLTDSRGFLSYTRHEYFRRILCNLIGEQVQKGFFPYDRKILKEIIEAVCYKNAKGLFE